MGTRTIIPGSNNAGQIGSESKYWNKGYFNELYTKYKILTYAGFNKDIKLFISPPLVIENSDIDYFVDAFENILDKQPLILIINFVKNYLLRIFNKD